MLPSVGLILLGFVVLMTGAEFIVRGAVALANKLNVPAMVIGLTVLAFGTALPEFSVAMRATMSGVGGIALGNVVGSNIANVLFILGFAAMVSPFRCKITTLGRDYKFLMFVTIMFMAMSWNGSLSRTDGLVLLFVLIIYLMYNLRNAKVDDANYSGVEEIVNYGWLTILFLLIVGGFGIRYGSNWLIMGSIEVMQNYGVSQEVMGLTMIAFGTSLPELATITMAAIKQRADLALGNVMGSNIMNILLIMGVASINTEINVPTQFLRFEMWVMLLSSASILPIVHRSKRLSRLDGATYFFGYIVFWIAQLVMFDGEF